MVIFLRSRYSLSSQFLKRVGDIYIACTLAGGVLSGMCVVVCVYSISLPHFTCQIGHVIATARRHCRKMAAGQCLWRSTSIALIRGFKCCSMKWICNRTRKQAQLSFSGRKDLTSCILTYCAIDRAIKHATEWSVVYKV